MMSYGRRTGAALCALGVAAFLAFPVFAAGEHDGVASLSLDPERSHADFEVKVLWLIGIHGRFGKVRGTIVIDRRHDTAVADARIDVDTITMRNRSYEEWVKSDEFFNSRAFPQIHFVSESFALDRLRSGGEIAGTLSLRGVDQRLVLQVAPSACVDAIASACPVEAQGTIRRSEFGMRSRRGTLSDKVELSFSIYLAESSGQDQRR